MTGYNSIGQSQPAYEGRAKVTGQIRFAGDIRLPGMLYARFVTSPYAHARLGEIDTAAAATLPGVAAVLAAVDLPEVVPDNRRRLLLARDRVLFAGQPVALVLADSEEAAQDGAELVVVDYDPLPAAITIEQALAEGSDQPAPLVWPEGLPGESAEAGAHGADLGSDSDKETRRTNVSDDRQYHRGDAAAAFKQADVIVERTFTTAMVHQNYLEPHATVIQPDPITGGVTVWTSTQSPFWVREEVAGILGVAESDVRVVGTPVGGAFGGKFVLYEPLLALAARQLNRPVRLVMTRLEEMLAGNPAPGSRIQVKLGARHDGTLTAVAADLVFEAGCYPSFHSIAALLLGSYYPVPNLDIRYREVLTFKPSMGAYRAPGVPQATFALESAMDELAQKLGLDPLVLRQQNAARPGDLMAHGRPWPGMGMREVLQAVADHPLWQSRSESKAASRGVGLAIGGWPGGTEPAAATCMLNRDGQLHVHLGSVDLTGTTTGFALIAAETFGIDPDQVRIVGTSAVTGVDTSSAPYAGGAGGSKITYTVGPAIVQAVQEAREQVLAIAADEFEADPADLEIVDGAVRVRGVPGTTILLARLAAKTMQFGGKYAPVMGRGRHANPKSSPGFCAQLAEVEVDPETGQVRVLKLVLIQDVGRAINPPGIQGQMMGGAVQGLGWALYEQMTYDDYGQLLTGSWAEYTVPHINQAAGHIETILVEVPSKHGPFGARGVGEPPVVATAGAVANAIADATGARLTDLPMTPARILAATDSITAG